MDISEHLAEHEAVVVGVARKVAWHYRLGRHAWKDLAQEAREELIRAHNGRYDHDRASLLTYAWRGINWRLEAVAQDFISKTNPADGLLFDQLGNGQADDMLVGDPDLREAWDQLDEAEQTTLRLYAIHPTLKEAAEAARLSVPTFRKRKEAAASKCRRLYYGEAVEIAKRRGRPRAEPEKHSALEALHGAPRPCFRKGGEHRWPSSRPPRAWASLRLARRATVAPSCVVALRVAEAPSSTART